MYEFLKENQFDYYNLRVAVLGKGIFMTTALKIQDELRGLNIDATVFEKFESVAGYKPNCVIVTCPIYYPYRKFKDRSIIWVGINSEQLLTPENGGGAILQLRLKQVKKYCKYFDILLDYDKSNIQAIKKFYKGRIERVYKSGYDVNFDIPEFITDEHKEYDILFYGADCQRRRSIIDFLSKRYNVYPRIDKLWGADLVDAIKKSKICLNLHAEETRYFEKMRVVQLFCNHAFVMSDRIYDAQQFEDGEDFASFFLSDICDRIDFYLKNENERSRIANNAYKKIVDMNNKAENYTRTILDCILIERYKRQFLDNPPIYKRVIRRLGVLFGCNET